MFADFYTEFSQVFFTKRTWKNKYYSGFLHRENLEKLILSRFSSQKELGKMNIVQLKKLKAFLLFPHLTTRIQGVFDRKTIRGFR
jgi:hypothetical protein